MSRLLLRQIASALQSSRFAATICCAASLFAAGLLHAQSDPSPAIRGDRRLLPSASSLSATMGYRSNYAVIIGINAYPGTSPGLSALEYAVNDAREMRDLLCDEFGYHADRMRFLLDADATRANLQQAFATWLPDCKLVAEDSVLVFFAGHGLIDDATKKGYLAAVDSDDRRPAETCLDVGWIRDQLAQLPCRHKLVVLDSCYSGSLFQRSKSEAPAQPYIAAAGGVAPAPEAMTAQRGAGPPAWFSDNLSYYLRQPAFLGISAGRFTPVADGAGAAKHSVFTAALLQVLRERADTPRQDHAFTFRQVASLVESRVANALDSRQIPDWGRLGDGDGDFLFRPTKRRETPREVSERRAEAVRRQGYAAVIREAVTALEGRNMPDLADRLREARPAAGNPPDFLWQYLLRQFQDRRFVGSLGVQKMSACGFSPSGSRLAAAGYDPIDGTPIVKVWEMVDGNPRELAVHRRDAPCRRLRFIDDEELLLVSEQTLTVCETTSGQERSQYQSDAPILCVEVGADSIAVGGNRTIVLLERAGLTKSHTLLGHFGYVKSLAFSPDGRLLVSTASDSSMRLWDVAAGREIRGSDWHDLWNDGYQLAAVGELPQRLIRGAYPRAVGLRAEAVFVSNDELSLIDGKGRDFQRLNLATGKQSPGPRYPDAFFYGPDSHQASAREYWFLQSDDTIYTYHLPTGFELPRQRLNLYRPQANPGETASETAPSRGGWCQDLSVSPDGRFVVAAIDDGYLYDLKRPQPIPRFADHVKEAGALALTPDGLHFVCGGNDGDVLLVRIADGSEVAKFVGHTGRIEQAALSTDGKTLVTRSVNRLIGEVIVWDFPARTERFRVLDVGFRADPPALSPDGRLLAISSQKYGKNLKVVEQTLIYETVTGRLTRELPWACSTTLFSPDGAHLWQFDGPSGRAAKHSTIAWNQETEGVLRPYAFSTDGRLAVCLKSDGADSAVEICTWPEGAPRSRLAGYENLLSLQSAAFSRDARLLVTADSRMVTVWDVATGGKLVTFDQLLNPRAVRFLPDDAALLCASLDQGVAIFRAGADAATKTRRDEIAELSRELIKSPHDAAALARRAQLHRERGNTAAAIDDLNRVLQLSDGTSDQIRELAELYAASFQYAAALATIDRHPQLGVDLILQKARLQYLVQLDRHVDVDAAVGKLLAAQPDATDLLLLRAEARSKLPGRAADAERDLARCLEVDPKNSRAYAVRARLHRIARREEEWLQDCNHALELNPDETEALLLRGYYYSTKRRYDESRRDFDRLLELDPHHVEGLVARGETAHAMGRLQAALQDYSRALEINPGNIPARRLKGDALIRLGEFAAAEKEYSAALATAPADYLSLTGQAHSLIKQIEGNSDVLGVVNETREKNALASLSKAMTVAPRATPAYVVRAELQKHLGRWEEALADLGRAIELEPTVASHAFKRGKLQFERERYDDAEIDIERVFKQFPNDAEIVKLYALILAKVGRYEAAVAQYDRLLDAFPHDVDLLCETAWLLATTDVAVVRVPSRAVELASRAVELTKRQSWHPLAVSAAARAAAGDFNRAFAEQLEATKIAPEEKRAQLNEDAALFARKRAIISPKPLRRLTIEVTDADRAVALAAIRAIGDKESAAASAVPALLAALQTPDFPFRVAVIHVLGRIGPPAAAALDVLRRESAQGEPPARVFSAWAVMKIDSEDRNALFVLIDQLRSEEQVQLVLEFLADLGPRAGPAADLIAKQLVAKDAAVVKLAVTALGNLRAAAAPQSAAIADRLKHDDESIRFSAVRALLQIGERQDRARDVLKELLKSETPLTRLHTAQLCQTDSKGAQAALPQLIALLGDEFHDIRAAAAIAIGALGADAAEAIPALKEAVDQPVRMEGRAAAIEALAKIGPPAIPAFESLLNAGDGTTRSLAAGMAGRLGTAAAPLCNRLAALAADETQSTDVREAALGTISRIGPAAASCLPTVAPLLQSQDAAVRAATGQALVGIGRADDPGLERMLRHEDRFVHATAALTLRRMGKQGKTPLLAALKDSSNREANRMQAAYELSMFEEGWIETLLDACAESDDAVVEISSTMLVGSGKKRGVDILPSLITALGDARPGVRKCAVRTLLLLNPPISELLPSLLQYLRGNDEELKTYAFTIIERWGEAAAEPLKAAQRSAPDAATREAAGKALSVIYTKVQRDQVLNRYDD